MDMQKLLEQLAPLFDDSGDRCDYGCDECSIQSMLGYVTAELGPLPYCVVKDWLWIDIEVTGALLEGFTQRGEKPSIIYAKQVVEDQQQREFLSVRTSPLRAFHRHCIFQTRNTAYVLCGPGRRISIAPEAYALIEWG